jgi:hypothetical protein
MGTIDAQAIFAKKLLPESLTRTNKGKACNESHKKDCSGALFFRPLTLPGRRS